ncbi:hypothetical protein V8E53_004170 [Lactarius tabidus]
MHTLQSFLAILTPLPCSFPFLLLSIVDGTLHMPSAENWKGKCTSSSIETGAGTSTNPPVQTNSNAAKKAHLAALHRDHLGQGRLPALDPPHQPAWLFKYQRIVTTHHWGTTMVLLHLWFRQKPHLHPPLLCPVTAVTLVLSEFSESSQSQDDMQILAPSGRALPLDTDIQFVPAKVKDYCNTITSPMLLAMPLQMHMMCYVQQEQLSNYNYTFPMMQKIIDVRGSSPFTSHFNFLFPTTETHDGVTIPELFATLYEWCSGEQVVTEFSANLYLDVYLGHVNTLKVIQDKSGNAFCSMMADIYSHAVVTANVGIHPGVPIAELNIDELKE